MICNRTLLALSLLLPSIAWADDCRFRADRSLSLPTADVAQLEVLAGAGELEIVGDPTASVVRVEGRACASSAERLAGIDVRGERSADGLRVEAVFPENAGWSGSMRLDLVLQVPASLALKVSDSSGDLRIGGVASLELEDSSGDIELRDIAGRVRIRDSSGDIRASSLGELHVPDDSSGEIRVDHVRGDAVIDNDSSGSVTLTDIGGNARVEVDSSGDIRFERIGGNAAVGIDSSGSIVARSVTGDFSVERDSSGGIDYRDIGGRVLIPDDGRRHPNADLK